MAYRSPLWYMEGFIDVQGQSCTAEFVCVYTACDYKSLYDISHLFVPESQHKHI